MKLTSKLIIAASFVGSTTARPSDFCVGQTVQTTSGPVQGHGANGISDVSEYLGIPFAKPPVGELRWAPPQSFCGTSTIKGDAFGHSCPARTGMTPDSLGDGAKYNITPHGVQVMLSMLGQVTDTFDEDCLTLNVWTKPQTGETKKAVLFWIYGGSFNTGSTTIPTYNGKYIADQEDVVVVSANYRVNIFGFPGDPNIQNNLGLLDQRLAIEWARDNVEAFGGDPARITIFGESAGGSAVDYYSYAWTSDPIVTGFIAQSGTVFSPDSQASPAKSAVSWYNVTGNLGCGGETSDPTSVLSCMRSKDWKSVQDAIPISAGISSDTGNFGPTIDNTVVFSDYLQRSLTGNFIKRPMMIGSTDYEVGLFKILYGKKNVTFSETEWDLLGLAIFTCSTSYRALASVVNKVPTWRYRWFGEFPNLELSSGQSSGAWHGSELPIIFGTDMDIQDIVARNPPQAAISTYVRGAWAAFAKDPVNGLTQYGMPRYHPLGSTLMQLAYNNQTGPNPTFPGVYDALCPVATLLADLLTL